MSNHQEAGPSADAVTRYYESVTETFRETRDGQEKDAHRNWIRGVVIALFSLSFIPAVPYVLSRVLPRLSSVQSFGIWRFHFALSSFWFWWPVCFVGSFLILIMVMAAVGPSEAEKQKWLSPSQMRFAYAYGGGVEIGHYKTNHSPRHIQTSIGYLHKMSQMLPMAQTAFRADAETYINFTEGADPSMDSIVQRHGLRPTWFRLDPETERILSAIRSFWPKVSDRLKDRKDLTAIEASVADLASYLYTEIPEISEGTSEDKQRLERFGMEALNRFAEQINELAPYRSEPAPASREEKVSKSVLSTGQQLNALFVHPNVALSLLVWLIVTSALFSLGFGLALHYIPSLKVDTTLLTAWVGGPIASSITAVTIPRLGKQHDKGNG